MKHIKIKTKELITKILSKKEIKIVCCRIEHKIKFHILLIILLAPLIMSNNNEIRLTSVPKSIVLLQLENATTIYCKNSLLHYFDK